MTPGSPWSKPLNAAIRGTLKDSLTQQSDGKRTILTPKAIVTATRKPSGFVRLFNTPPSTPTGGPPSSPTPTPTIPPDTPPLTPLTSPTPPPATPSAPPFSPFLLAKDLEPQSVEATAEAVPLSIAVSHEKEKYQGIYAVPSSYGHSNHGKESSPIWDTWNISRLLDVGCGHNEFVDTIRKDRPWIFAMGADFACPSADVIAEADRLPFSDQNFDLLTSFDMLEHLLPGQVSSTLKEFARVSKAFVFSISYVPSKILYQGENLHPTVRPESWWVNRIAAAGGINIKRQGRYLAGQWKNSADITKQPLFFAPEDSMILVGNGPSVLRSELGSKVDAFKHVVRFNTYKTRGFEKQIGKKTTIWSTFGHGALPQDHSRPKNVLFTRGASGSPAYVPRNIWRIPASWMAEKTKEVCQISKMEDQSKLMASSGFIVATWLIEQGASISLAGFDHFSKAQSGQHHYWLKRTFKKPKEHDGDAEATLLLPLVKAGKIVYL